MAETKWKGLDPSMNECIENYGMVYKYDGEDFEGYAAVGFDENGSPVSFSQFGMDNNTIDDYFDEEGNEIANMCGTKPEDMDYEWKFEALLSYYGISEFENSYKNPITKDELIELVKDNWSCNV